MTRVKFVVRLVATLGMFVLVLSGCGGDTASADKRALEDYLAGMRTGMTSFIHGSQAGNRLNTGTVPLDSPEFMSLMRTWARDYRRAALQLQEVEPPAALRDVHVAFVDRLGEAARDMRATITLYKHTMSLKHPPAKAQAEAIVAKAITALQTLTDSYSYMQGAFLAWVDAVDKEMARLEMPAPDWMAEPGLTEWPGAVESPP